MPRVIFKDGQQPKFIKKIKEKSGLINKELAFLCGINERTFRDWGRGKYSISEAAFKILIDKYSLPLPENIRVVEDYWYVAKGARKGALRRFELYGSLGTPEGRSKGGRNSQQKRKENPEFYRILGCNIRKKFHISEPSINFAEAVGIILGDGSITDCQVNITVSQLVDRAYAHFVYKLFNQVFGEEPKWTEQNSCHVIRLTLTGIGLVEELEKRGFIRGDKIKNQVDFPKWIWKNLEFQKACVRGLVDTDGGCYFHLHKSNDILYQNFGWSFCNHSLPLVRSVAKVLKSLGLKFSIAKQGRQIYIYSWQEIKKYFSLIGSNNPKNWVKFNSYLNKKTHRVGCGSGLTGDPGKIVWM